MTGDQRRLAAIVLADVAGYSRLMGQDESGTHAVLKAVMREVVGPKVAEHSGRVVKTMGDGVLLEFASAVNAVRCSLDIQRTMADRNAGVLPDRMLRFRLGINVGDILIDGEDIFGGGVNVAARLQSLADPGGICVSKVVRDQVQGKLDVEFEPLGVQRVKNIADPVDVYRARLDEIIGSTSPGFRRRIASFVPARHAKRLAAGSLVVATAGAAIWAVVSGLEGTPEPSPPALTVAFAPLATSPGDSETLRGAEAITRYVKGAITRGPNTVRPRVVGWDAAPASSSTGRRQRATHRYLVEGEVGRDGSRFDVQLRLVDATKGEQLWSARHALQAADLSAEFSPPLNALSKRLRSAMYVAEKRRVIALPLSKLSPPELLVRAHVAYEKDQSVAGVREALDLVDRALRLDPNYAAAWSVKGYFVNVEGDVDPHQDRDRLGREQDAFSARAVALDPTDAVIWAGRSTALAYLGRWDAALEAYSKAITLEPSEMEYRFGYAWVKGLMGRPDEALKLIDEALKFDPEHKGSAARAACEAHVLAGHASAAVTACETSATLFNGDWVTIVLLVAAYANNGDAAKAAAARAELLRTVPGYTIAQLRAKRYSDHPDYLVLAEKNWYSGLRKAGVPEK